MKLKSLGYKTDLIFNELTGSVEEKENYLVVKHGNPNYFWGNLLIFDTPPTEGIKDEWETLFEKEITHPSTYHKTFGWDSPEGELGSVKQFTDADYDLEKSVVLAAAKTRQPSKYNTEVEVRAVETDDEFEEVIQVQLATAHDRISMEEWNGFYRKQQKDFRDLISKGKGHWYGAFLDNKLVGSLGVFYKDNLARYQIVSTHPDYQRRGICGRLVYETANITLDRSEIDTLVMIADEDYHAAKIYESVGFEPKEKLVGVCWHKKV